MLLVPRTLVPEKYGPKLDSHIVRPVRPGETGKRADIIYRAISDYFDDYRVLFADVSSASLATLVIGFTRAYPHLPVAESGAVRDEWKIPRFVQSLIELIGERADSRATNTLQHLREHRSMRPWRDHIAHTMANREHRLRELTFRRPSLSEVLGTLRGGPPTRAADLFALLTDKLKSVADDIRNGGTDGFKMFWADVSGKRIRDSCIEEICRDRLLERLRPELQQVGVSLDREPNFAEHKRADIRATRGASAIPIECKRHDNRALWSAIAKQLIPKYTRDPSCEGFGIYCVFWFGLDEARLPSPPEGIAPPTTAAELAEGLRETISAEHASKIAVVCVDVARPQVEPS